MFTSVPRLFDHSIIGASREPPTSILPEGQDPPIPLESYLIYKSSRQAAPYFMLLYKTQAKLSSFMI